MTDREELKRFAAVVRQYIESRGESKAAKQAMLNGLEYVEKLTSDNSEYIQCSCIAGCEMCEDKRK